VGLIDLIEFLGSSVDDGLMPVDEAVQRLVEFSERGLTHRGARDSLAKHQTVRANYDRTFRETKAMLDKLQRKNGPEVSS
jgi:hypothetical protein